MGSVVYSFRGGHLFKSGCGFGSWMCFRDGVYSFRAGDLLYILLDLGICSNRVVVLDLGWGLGMVCIPSE